MPSELVITAFLMPLLLFVFRGVRDWFGRRIWKPIKNLFSARAELRAEFAGHVGEMRTEFAGHVERLRDEISKAINEHFSMFHSELGSIKSDLSKRFTVIDCRRHLSFDEDASTGVLECDENGAVVWASRTMTQWMGSSREDFNGSRWMDYVVPSERQHARDELQIARDQHQPARLILHMGPHGEKGTKYRVTASPMPDKRPAFEWVMRFHPVGIDPREIVG
jgi:PAS domain-containing protein